MGLRKGQTNNPKGRPRGTTNKDTRELRERIKSFLDENWVSVENDMKTLEPRERVQMYERLLKYCLPTLQSSKAEINFDAMSEDQLNTIINKIINNETSK